MAITMRMVAQIFFFATEVTQGPLSSLHYTHIKRTPKSRCAICNGCEDTAKMSPRSRGTCLADLAGDPTPTHNTPTPRTDDTGTRTTKTRTTNKPDWPFLWFRLA
jgi:hypothetical protein